MYICQPYSPKSCQPLPRSISLHSFSTSFSLLCSPSAKLEQHLDQKMLLSFLLFIVFLSRISYLNLVWSMGIIRRVFFRRFFFFSFSINSTTKKRILQTAENEMAYPQVLNGEYPEKSILSHSADWSLLLVCHSLAFTEHFCGGYLQMLECRVNKLRSLPSWSTQNANYVW